MQPIPMHLHTQDPNSSRCDIICLATRCDAMRCHAQARTADLLGRTQYHGQGCLCTSSHARFSIGHTPEMRHRLAVEPVLGELLFSGGADYRVHMWDLRSRTLLHTLAGHSSTVRTLCFTPSGQTLSSSGGDFNLLVWRLSHEQEGEARQSTEEGPLARE